MYWKKVRKWGGGEGIPSPLWKIKRNISKSRFFMHKYSRFLYNYLWCKHTKNSILAKYLSYFCLNNYNKLLIDY